MYENNSNEYLKNAVMSASQEQLTLMLYDGAIRFATQGRDALAKGDFEASCEKLIRAQKIVLELRNGLRYEVNPALCEQMAGLYGFIYNRLVDANVKRSLTLIDEALKILRHQRETWQLLMDKVRTEQINRHAADDADDIRMSLSIQG
ncbi:MAG: flagellar export chaperone FliS [Phycisphaerales bacterium]|nr:flagellar export chaperone FliS [Phycisphaerales bacterium]